MLESVKIPFVKGEMLKLEIALILFKIKKINRKGPRLTSETVDMTEPRTLPTDIDAEIL